MSKGGPDAAERYPSTIMRAWTFLFSLPGMIVLVDFLHKTGIGSVIEESVKQHQGSVVGLVSFLYLLPVLGASYSYAMGDHQVPTSVPRVLRSFT
jgi:hypothetical protein